MTFQYRTNFLKPVFTTIGFCFFCVFLISCGETQSESKRGAPKAPATDKSGNATADTLRETKPGSAPQSRRSQNPVDQENKIDKAESGTSPLETNGTQNNTTSQVQTTGNQTVLEEGTNQTGDGVSPSTNGTAPTSNLGPGEDSLNTASVPNSQNQDQQPAAPENNASTTGTQNTAEQQDPGAPSNSPLPVTPAAGEETEKPATPDGTAAPLPPQPQVEAKVLVFTKTAGFRHRSIADGVRLIEQLASENSFSAQVSEDAGIFTDQGLNEFAAVVFLNTTGNILNGNQEQAFERFIGQGKGFVGVHAATDTEYQWEFYGNLVGAYFNGHPAIQRATLRNESPTNPASSHYPGSFERTDEWYNFDVNPRQKNVHVLLTLDESTYQGGQMGNDHPIAWCQHFGGGRSFYTAGGHTSSTYSEPAFRTHLLGGIQFAIAGKSTDCVP